MNGPLFAGDLLRMWERAETPTSNQTRALLVLGVLHPGVSWESLRALSIGRREQQLLELRERFMGGNMSLSGECPQCEGPVDLALTTREIGGAAAGDEVV